MNVDEKINEMINNFDGNISLYVKDDNGKIIKNNENDIVESASCIKLFILIEFYNQILNNKKSREDMIKYSSKEDCMMNGSGLIKYLDDFELSSKNIATLMIIISDNVATNKMIEYLGFDNINKTIKDLGFNHTILKAKKLDFDIYNSVGETTAYEYARAYEMLLKHEILTPELCDEIISILSHQRINVMITKFLSPTYMDEICDDKFFLKFIASKSGSLGNEENDAMSNCRNDGGIISTSIGNYIFSIFIRNFNDYYYYDDNIAIVLGAKISKMIFESFKKHNGSIK